MTDTFNFMFAALLVVMALCALLGRYSRTASERETAPAGRATGGAFRVSRSELVSQECTSLHDHQECAWLECSCQCHLIEESSNYQEES